MKGFWKLAALCAAFIAGCGGGDVSSPDFVPDLVSVTISPTSATVPIGETQQFTAAGEFTAQPGAEPPTTTRAITPNWSVSDTSIATIDGDGVLTAVDDGSVTVTAEQDGITASATVTVPAPTLTAITVDPATATILVGENVTFTATGTYQNSPDSEPTSGPVTVSWSSSDASIATITSSGVASGQDPGVVTITASNGSVQGTATLNVVEFMPVLTAITVTPIATEAPIGDNVQFTATGVYTAPGGGTTTGPVEDVVWAVSNESIATIDEDTGVASALTQGSTTVTASSGGVTGSATLTVTAPALRSITVSPETADVPLGGTQVYTAMGIYSDSSTPRPIDGTVTWTSADTAIATVTPTGSSTTATAEAAGTTMITANSGGFSDTAEIVVTEPELAALIRIEPETARVVPGTSQEFTAYGSFTDGSESALADANIVWSSSDDTIATVDADGIATGVAQGEVTITATLADGYVPSASPRSASADLLVANPVCSIPLRATDNASVVDSIDGLCLLCSVENTANLVDNADENFATISVPVGLLTGGASVTVNTAPNASYAVPFPAGTTTGFIIGRPAGALVLAEVASQIEVTTLLDGEVSETSGDLTPLRLDLLGLQLTDSTADELLSVSLTTTAPFDAIRLRFNSGLASALSSVQVYNACGQTTLPPEVPALVEVVGIEPETGVVALDSASGFSLIGLYEDGEERAIPASDVNWSVLDAATAAVDVSGLVTGLGLGETTITGRLKDGVAPDVTTREASTTITVIAESAFCTTPLLAAKGAYVLDDIDGLCLLCGISNTGNIVDPSTDNFANISVPVGLLGGSASVTVAINEDGDYELPFDGTQQVGFVIGRPAGSLLLVELGSQLEVTTYLDDVEMESSGDITPLRLDLLGLNLSLNNDQALASLQTSKPFDKVRLTFNSGLVSALSGVQVYSACATAQSPAP